MQRRCFQCGSVPLRSDIKGTELPPANTLIPLERQLRYNFVIELLFLSLAVEALQGKTCQNSLPSGGGRSLGAKIPGERVVPLSLY